MLRNVALPAITLQFASIGELIGGSVLVEHPVGAEGVGKAGGQIFPGKVGKLSRFGQSFSGKSNYEQ